VHQASLVSFYCPLINQSVSLAYTHSSLMLCLDRRNGSEEREGQGNEVKGAHLVSTNDPYIHSFGYYK
jgi:hypothetical protein